MSVLASAPPDFAFIDGMHRFEFALRDFMNIERHAHAATLVVVDDIFPCHPRQAERTRQTRVWTGDVWKLAQCLREVRPDLLLVGLDTAPTGLLLIAGLDRDNRVLWDNYNPFVRRYRQLPEPPAAVLSRSGAVSPFDPVVDALAVALRRARDSGATHAALAATLHAFRTARSPA